MISENSGGSNGFSLLEGGERSDKNNPSNLTSNQRSSMTSSQRSECCSLADEASWKIPFGLLGLFTFIAFILACVGVSMGSSNSDSIDSLTADMSTKADKPDTDSDAPDPDCPYGDVIWGQEPIPGPGGHNFYQVVGGSKAAITWHSAMKDAQSRCYRKHKGYLVNIGSADEDAFVNQIIQGTGGFSSGDAAWIGATDMLEEGTFSWIGPKKMVRGVAFYKNGLPIDGAYTNWADGEPNEGGASELSEDCVSKYGSGDFKWNDKNCYYTNPFFVVEFGPPKDKDEYEEQNDDTLDDDALESNDDGSTDDSKK